MLEDSYNVGYLAEGEYGTAEPAYIFLHDEGVQLDLADMALCRLLQLVEPRHDGGVDLMSSICCRVGMVCLVVLEPTVLEPK